MDIKITECACCGNRDSSRFIQKSDGYVCKTCGVWFRYETEEEKAGCMDGRRRLKNYRFDDAYEAFMEVLDKYPKSIDALWGTLLARYGIVFVNGFFDDTAEPIYCFPEYDEYGGRRFCGSSDYCLDNHRFWNLFYSKYIQDIIGSSSRTYGWCVYV